MSGNCSRKYSNIVNSCWFLFPIQPHSNTHTHIHIGGIQCRVKFRDAGFHNPKPSPPGEEWRENLHLHSSHCAPLKWGNYSGWVRGKKLNSCLNCLLLPYEEKRSISELLGSQPEIFNCFTNTPSILPILGQHFISGANITLQIMVKRTSRLFIFLSGAKSYLFFLHILFNWEYF